MLIAALNLAFDPAWPWSLPGVGMPALALTAGILVALTVWTYWSARGSTGKRLLVILGLRLAALVVACLLVLRPSLAFEDDSLALPSKLSILLDCSESMTTTDAFNSESRWDHVRKLLAAPAVKSALQRLQRIQRVEIVYYQGAEEVRAYNPESAADGKGTDIGRWLHDLLLKHGGDSKLRGLVLMTDGADNGTMYVALKEAARWRGTAPIHTFAVGLATTTIKLRDIDLANLSTEPMPSVPVKGEFTVRGIVNAPGFENSTVEVKLYIEERREDPKTGKTVVEKRLAAPAERVMLTKTAGNEVKIKCDAPSHPGDLKVTLQVQDLPGEVTKVNNEKSTYVTVTKEGVSILWVEGKLRAFESVFAIRHALSRDPRFRIYHAVRLKEAKPSRQEADLFNFDKQHYDVIVIGDVSATRFSGGNQAVFNKIASLVEKGTGLLMIGGYEALGNTDWQGTAIQSLLPVILNKTGQFEGPVRVTPNGFDHYLLRLADNPEDNKALWQKLDPLDGMTPIGQVKGTATLLATRDGGEPILAGTRHGEGRTLVFGGDTTWKAWRRTPESIEAYQRFWKQTMLWLARQEQTDTNVWIKPDTRRISKGHRLGFNVGMRGKTGIDLKNASFNVKVITPDKQEIDIPIAPEGGGDRGYVWKTGAPGEYTIIASGEAKDVDGKVMKPAKATEARFMVEDQDLENLRRAADFEFLQKLAQAGGGEFHLADERKFTQFLDKLSAEHVPQSRSKADLWPDWRQGPASDTAGDQLQALWNSTALVCFLAFAAFLCVEWFLRRRWGMV